MVLLINTLLKNNLKLGAKNIFIQFLAISVTFLLFYIINSDLCFTNKLSIKEFLHRFTYTPPFYFLVYVSQIIYINYIANHFYKKILS